MTLRLRTTLKRALGREPMERISRHIRICIGCPEHFNGMVCTIMLKENLDEGKDIGPKEGKDLWVPLSCPRYLEQTVLGQKSK
jgi:hypothetical protein